MNHQRRMTIWVIIVTAFMANAATQSPVKTDSVPARKLMATDTAAPADSSARKIALIATSGSYLENAVIKIIADSLSRRGITVKTTDLQGLSRESSTSYATILVFGAAKKEKLADPVNKFALGVLEGATASNILICTVYGDLWDPKKASMDAVTGPTKTIKPMVIAGKIMQRLDTVFSRMPTSGKAGR